MRKHRVEWKRTGDVNKDLSPEQLAGIGRAMIAYNEAEIFIRIILESLLLIPVKLRPHFRGHISSIPSNIDLAKASLKALDAPKALTSAFCEAMGKDDFGELKQWRDGIAHALVANAEDAIAETSPKKGDEYDVLLSVKALSGLYERLVLMKKELATISMAVDLIGAERLIVIMGDQAVDQHRSQSAPKIQSYLDQCQRHRRQRRALEPLPEFPDELRGPPARDIFAEAEQWLHELHARPPQVTRNQAPRIGPLFPTGGQFPRVRK